MQEKMMKMKERRKSLAALKTGRLSKRVSKKHLVKRDVPLRFSNRI